MYSEDASQTKKQGQEIVSQKFLPNPGLDTSVSQQDRSLIM